MWFLELWEQFWWGEAQKNNHAFGEEWKLKPWWSVTSLKCFRMPPKSRKGHNFIVHCAQKSHSCYYRSPESTTSPCSAGIVSGGGLQCCWFDFSSRSKTLPRNDISSVCFNCRRSTWTKMSGNRQIQRSQCYGIYNQKWVISAIQSHSLTVYLMAEYLKQQNNKYLWDIIEF